MKVIKGLNNIRPQMGGSVVTIGVFDGVHIGHRKILAKVVSRARELRLKSVVVTFEPHPLKVLHPALKTSSIISLDHRIRMIAECGVDLLSVLNFTPSLARMPSRDFTRKVLMGLFRAREVYVGENFYFGKGARTGTKALKDLAARFGFRVRVVKPVKALGLTVSSSLIRKFITRGDLRRAAIFLDRPVSVLGTVVSGARIGRVLGYPTANINPHHEVIPPSGVYAVRIYFNGRTLKGILNIGLKPTFFSPTDKEPSIEVNIFDFDEKIYGKDIEILFVRKIRDELKFNTITDLAAQIKRDAIKARRILS